jgi:phenylacetate-CoA ligase
MFASGLYAHSPRWVQEQLISGRDSIRKLLREGPKYREQLQRALERGGWSSTDLQNFQLEKLRALVSYAELHVPYYRSAFSKAGIRAAELELPADLAKLPIITKQTIMTAGRDLLSDRKKFGRIKGSTSGTTGTPVTVFQDLLAISAEKAFLARHLGWAGYRDGDAQAWIRGDMVVPAGDRDGPFWRMNRVENMLMMSSYHLAERTADSYLGALADFRPTMIQAYPSSIAFLARYLMSRDRYFDSNTLRSIVTSSETMSDEDRRVIQERFRCRVFDWYGAFERVAAIGTCEKGTYHVLSDYSYVELEEASDGLFEIIGTGFNNRVMPLIRYRTGDFVELPEPNRVCDCGRSFPIVTRVIGRQDDYIHLGDGRRIGRMDHVFKGMAGIAEAQIVQDQIDRIKILIVPLQGFSPADERSLIENVHQRTGKEMHVTVETVPSIPRTRNGKFRSVISCFGQGRG